MSTPLVFDVHRSSTSDGPGLRTVLFLKGCPLNCYWCHNPEGKSPQPELAWFKEQCVGCNACQNNCTHKNACTACGACATVCPTGAKRLYGTPFAKEELFELIMADKPYFDATGGGVTFSGGECMLYPQEVASLAKDCRENGIHVAIDTSGQVPYRHFEAVLPFVDLFLYDIKCLDPDLHRRGTGADNTLILSNLEKLRKTGTQILIRTPVIPDFNEGAECDKIRQFCQDRNLSVAFLPYHALGESKQAALMAERHIQL